MDTPVLTDSQKFTFIGSATKKTYYERWPMGTDGKRESKESVLLALCRIWLREAFNKFPDFFCTGIWNCRRLLKIQYVIAIHHIRWQSNFYDFRFKWTATATEAWLSQLVNFKNAICTLEEQYAKKFCFKLRNNAMRWKLDLLLWPRDQETEFPVEACWLSQT